MKEKTKVIIILIMALLIAIIFIMSNKSYSNLADFISNHKTTSYSAFISDLSKSNALCIIANYNISNEVIRRNVLQCAVDLRYSWTLATNKSSYFFVINNELCYDDSSKKYSIKQCLSKFSSLEHKCTFFYIDSINKTKTNTLQGLMTIGIGENYKKGDCSILLHKDLK